MESLCGAVSIRPARPIPWPSAHRSPASAARWPGRSGPGGAGPSSLRRRTHHDECTRADDGRGRPLRARLVPAAGRAHEADDPKLPVAVRKTFEAKFPDAVIEKVDAEEEGGVVVYDIEFKDGATEKETDIAADGTMLEFTLVIDAKAVPWAAMKPIREAAAGAKMKRVEEIKISNETKGGKVLELPATVTHYAVEMTKGGKTAEIVVDADGKVVEDPRWADAK